MLKENETQEFKLKNGKKICPGDIIYITMRDGDDSVIAKGRYTGMSAEGNIKLYVIDPKYNLVDVEVKPARIVKSEKPN